MQKALAIRSVLQRTDKQALQLVICSVVSDEELKTRMSGSFRISRVFALVCGGCLSRLKASKPKQLTLRSS